MFTRVVSTSSTTDDASKTTARPEGAGRPRRSRGRVVGLVLLLLVVAGVALVFCALPLLHAKHEADAAQADLQAAKTAVSDHRIGRARTLVANARDHVDAAQADANGFGPDVWSFVPVAGGAVDDSRHLVDALSEATTVAQLGVQVYPMVSGHSSTLLQGQSIDIDVLDQVVQRTTAIGDHLDAAIADLHQVSGSTPVVGDSVAHAKHTALGYLLPLQESYQGSGPLVQSLPSLVGADGKRRYLLAMLNPSEQRFSGGGALSFTSLTFDHGRASFGNTVDVNEILQQGLTQTWKPVAGNVFHKPGPSKVANSTFSPWWSVSAEELLRGYEATFPGEKYDGVIGIDLQGLAALFRITGPVDLPHFGTVSADNLVSTVAGSYDKYTSIEQRKQLNTELVPAFRDKFFTGGQMQDKVRSLLHSADSRDFFVYVRNHLTQMRFARVGLAGNLSPTGHDYLGVFSQNTNGSKTDYWQHRDVSYDVKLRPDGSGLSKVHVLVRNDAPAYALPGPDPGVGYSTRYMDGFLGLFFANGSQLRSFEAGGTSYDPVFHIPRVAGVHNRKYVVPEYSLDAGQSWTLDASYVVPSAAVVEGDGKLTYRLDIDPQPLVTPETVDVRVKWPAGWHPTAPLPEGWKAVPGGAVRRGPLDDVVSVEIPLSKG
jgi:Protein of unknown function (DUF4012)